MTKWTRIIPHEMLFGDSETALITDIAMVEMWLILVECDIVDGDGEPLLAVGMPYQDFIAGLTAIWQHDPALFWDLHKVVREANPGWAPVEDGNE